MKKSMYMLIRACAVASMIFTTGCAESQQLEGAWNLHRYVMAGEKQEGVSGLLVLAEGRFGLIYTMRRNGELNGRGHAGGYTSEKDRLIFDVEWWPEEVDGIARAAAPAREVADIDQQGDILEMRFGSGSLQRWRRVKGAAQKDDAEARRLENVVTGGQQQDAKGLLVEAAGQFALFAESKRRDGSVDVRAYGGTSRGESEADGNGIAFISRWYVGFTEGEGEVSNAEQSIILRSQDREVASLQGSDGRIYKLQR
jgi:hypothetical protein